MPRATGLVLIAIGAGAAFAAPPPPPTQIPECNRKVIEEALGAGRVPDFSGCPAKLAIIRIGQTFANRYLIETLPDDFTAGAKPGIVTRQSRDGQRIRLHVPARPKQTAAEAAAAVPQPAPPPVPAQVDIAVADIAEHSLTAPPAASQQVSFSILDAAAVEEGKPLIFRVSREGSDGAAHVIELGYYKDPSLLVDPPSSIRFEAGDPPQKDLILRTAAGQPGDGPHSIQVLLRPVDARIGASRLGTGIITDATPPPSSLAPSPAGAPVPVTYRISADEPVRRGSDLSFTVSRSGPLGSIQVPYRVTQEGTASAQNPGNPRHVDFAEGKAEAKLTVPEGEIAACGEAVTVTLDDAAGTNAVASFLDAPPDGCDPPPWWRVVLNWLGGNLPLAIGGVALAGAIALDWILKPFVTVHPSCTIDAGALAFDALEQPVSRWPETGADVVIEPGELSVTQPLPRAEHADE